MNTTVDVHSRDLPDAAPVSLAGQGTPSWEAREVFWRSSAAEWQWAVEPKKVLGRRPTCGRARVRVVYDNSLATLGCSHKRKHYHVVAFESFTKMSCLRQRTLIRTSAQSLRARAMPISEPTSASPTASRGTHENIPATATLLGSRVTLRVFQRH